MALLNIFLIRESVTDPGDVIKNRDSLDVVVVMNDNNLLGTLHVQKAVSHTPDWINYFENSDELKKLKIRTQSSAAVLLVKEANRLFALVFGFGRFLLKDEAIERRFGLRVVLNLVEPEQLRSLDHVRLDGVPRTAREQLSRADRISHFGLDVERDILRALTGRPRDKKLATRITGSDVLAVSGDLPLAKLRQVLRLFLESSKGESYRQDFGWVDNIAQERNSGVITKLEQKLVSAIRKRSSTVTLSVPDIVDWTAVSGFSYSNRQNAESVPELDLGEYLAQRSGQLSLETLEKERVHLASGEEGRATRSWSVYRCLVAEIGLGGAQYVLSAGNWYRIDRDFLEAVDTSVKGIAATSLAMPAFKAGEDEGAYNKRVAKESKGDFALLDKNLVTLPKRKSVEVCDLYHRDKAFVHVKRYRSSSSSVSHLFLQTLVSGELFLFESQYRKSFAQRLPQALQWGDPETSVAPGDFEVCLAVVGREGGPMGLPFFGRLGLRNTVVGLRRLGYRPTYATIKVS